MKFQDLVKRLEERRKRARLAKRPAGTWLAQLARLEARRAARLLGAQRGRTVEFQLGGVNARSERSKRA
jgi:hypothetical protein